MPELPDITVYIEHLDRRLRGRTLEHIRIASPSLLRSVDPPPAAAEGRRVAALRRLGKRIVFGLEGDLFLVLHLMVAGRLHWKQRGAAIPRRRAHAAFDFPHGTLLVTEAATRKRASLHVVRGEAALAEHDPGGLEVLEAGRAAFRERLRVGNHSLKRALSDPRLFSGIGNAYSDEILHAARLSPLRRTRQLSAAEIDRLYDAARATLRRWTERLRQQAGEAFPARVTASRQGMSVHGRFRQPCPVCAAPVQRIAYAQNETHYCPVCQTGGRLLADRALSRLLKKDWPRTWEELEARRGRPRDG